jgi:hypothetical protein
MNDILMMPTFLRRSAMTAAFLLPVVCVAAVRAQVPTSPEDELVFTNGDKLSGKLTRVAGGSVLFHSDMAGDITVSLDKVKELHTQGAFALLKQGETQGVARKVPLGKVDVADATVKITPTGAPAETAPTKDVAYLLDATTFNRDVVRKPKLMDGWNGTANLGVTVVQASQHGDTITAGTALVRQVPTFALFAPRYRTLLGFQETYGTLTQDAEPAAGIVASTVKTSILHAGAEHDVYLSKKLFVLGNATFDHNYALLLQLQQVYGIGVGYTVFSTPKHQLDVRVDAHYEKQEFTNPTSNVNLFGSTFSEAYRRSLPLKIQFTEALSLIPSWNDPSVFSLNANAGLALPVYHRLSVNLSAADFYLTNPPAGTQKNSFQFVTGLSYSLR